MSKGLRFLISAIGGVSTTVILVWIGHQRPEIKPLSLIPGIVLAIFIPGVHGPFEDAAKMYNAVFYTLLIYGIWSIIVLANKKSP